MRAGSLGGGVPVKRGMSRYFTAIPPVVPGGPSQDGAALQYLDSRGLASVFSRIFLMISRCFRWKTAIRATASSSPTKGILRILKNVRYSAGVANGKAGLLIARKSWLR